MNEKDLFAQLKNKMTGAPKPTSTSAPKPTPTVNLVFRSQLGTGSFFFPRMDPFDDWGLTADQAVSQAEDAINDTAHRETEAHCLLIYAAFRGHPKAMYLLGKCYYNGKLELVDKILSEHWMRRCASLGKQYSTEAAAFVKEKFGDYDVQRASRTAMNYILGKNGCAVNYHMAFPWCKIAAEHGDVAQMTNLGYFLWKGFPEDGILRNRDQATAWLLRAASAGYPDAIKNVKACLDKDVYPHARELEPYSGAPASSTPSKPASSSALQLGTEYYHKCNRPLAAFYLDRAFRNGCEAEVRDLLLDFDHEGDEDFQKAYDDAWNDSLTIKERLDELLFHVDVNGYSKACFPIGNLYIEAWEDGDSNDPSYEIEDLEAWGNAAYYYLYGAVNGYYSCMFKLGMQFYYGRVYLAAGQPAGAEEFDYEAAVYWFKRACGDDGWSGSQAAGMLGDMYINGEFFAKDPYKAHEYYQEGARKGNEGCLYMLGQLYYFGDGCTKDLHKAYDYFNQARLKGHHQAALWTAQMLHNGEGVASDWRAAKKIAEGIPSYISEAADLLAQIKREHPLGL